MSITVNAPAGNIGRVLTRLLLEAGRDVTMISRHPEKVGDLAAAGARLVAGSFDDPGVLARALGQGGSLFWLTPPPMRHDFRDWAVSTARLAVRTAGERGVRRAVVISSAGAHNGPGTGPVAVLKQVEDVFTDGFSDLIILRPGFYMENLLLSVNTIAQASAIYQAIPSGHPLAFVASRDIANMAAGFLMDDHWSGRRIVGVHGPEDLDFDRASRIISAGVGKTVTYVEISLDQVRTAMLESGYPDFVVETYAEMVDAIGRGKLDPAEPRTAETTTPTSLAQFVEQVLKPAVGAAAAAT